MTTEGGSAYVSKRPAGIGIGALNKMLAARRGDESVTESSKKTGAMGDMDKV